METNALASTPLTCARTVALLSCVLVAWVQSTASSAASDPGMDLESIEKGLQWKKGEIAIGDHLVTLSVPSTFRFLGPTDAQIVLTKLWGNPLSKDYLLGMIFPEAVGPMDHGSWGVVITYAADGYVKDDDAAQINYHDLFERLQKETEDQNSQRIKEGYPAVHLDRWAAPPYYNRETHKLFWAQEFSFDGVREDTLNYHIRVLGRGGVLVLTIVAPMTQFQEIERQIPEVIAMANFSPGNSYADFTPGTDKMAEYGLVALILGGVAAKTGLFQGVLAVLFAAKKFIIIGVAAIFTFLSRIFRRKKAVVRQASSGDAQSGGPTGSTAA
jgi:uncharacterized membrane-anchored protein